MVKDIEIVLAPRLHRSFNFFEGEWEVEFLFLEGEWLHFVLWRKKGSQFRFDYICIYAQIDR